MRLSHRRGIVAGFVSFLALVPVALGQYQSGFEALAADPDGEILSGQEGYYLPAGIDYNAYTYAGNTLGLPQNPVGGLKFIAGTRVVDQARAERAQDFTLSDVWTLSYDMAVTIDPNAGPGGSTIIGSFSLQPSGTAASFNNLITWVDPTLTAFNAGYRVVDAAGTSMDVSAGPEWENLELGHWYRAWTTVRFSDNRVVEVSIVDLVNGHGATFNPDDWYMNGGAAGRPAPEAFRFFTGNADGNVMAWDNISVIPEPASLALLALGGLALIRRR